MSLQSVLQEVETGGRYGYQMDVPTYLRLKEIADQMAQYDAEMNGPSPSLAEPEPEFRNDLKERFLRRGKHPS